MTQEIKICREVTLPGSDALIQAAEIARTEKPQNAPVLPAGIAQDTSMSAEMKQERLISALAVLQPSQIATVLTSETDDIIGSLIVMADRLSIALMTTKMWANGRILRIAFMGGDPVVRERVTAVAKQWQEIVNLTFDFVNDAGESDIRIAFQPGDGSWSYIGTDALLIPQDQPTMNFGWLTPASSDDTYNRVVLHEFGHALGAIHEHQHPEQNIPWDKDAVYAYYSGPPNNWSKGQVDTNLFQKYAVGTTNFSDFDPQSIMLYPITNDLTISDWEVGWNSTLSKSDKAFMRTQYPDNGGTNGQTGDDSQLVLGEFRSVDIAQPGQIKKLTFTTQTTDSYIFETKGDCDTFLKLYRVGNGSTPQLIRENDDGGEVYNARIVSQNLPAGDYQLQVSLFEQDKTGSFQFHTYQGNL